VKYQDATKFAFALDGLIRSRTKGHGGEEYARKCVREIAEALTDRENHTKYLEKKLETLAALAKRAKNASAAPDYDEEEIRDALWALVRAAE
jgi:hypothetical protein